MPLDPFATTTNPFAMPNPFGDPFGLGQVQAPARTPAIPSLTPQEQEGLLSQIGSGALHGLGWIGGLLDKSFGGRAIRAGVNMLGGGNTPTSELLSFIPGSDAFGLTNPENSVSGAELLGGNKDTPFLSEQGLGGTALELALDPSTYLTFGGSALTGLGKKALQAGIKPAGGAARAAGLAGKEAEQLARFLTLGERAGPVAPKAIADVTGKSLGGHLGVGLPFGGNLATFDLTRPIQSAGSVLEAIPGFNRAAEATAPLRRGFSSLFDANVKGQIDPVLQEEARRVSSATPEVLYANRGKMAKLAEEMQALSGWQRGMDWTPEMTAKSNEIGKQLRTAIERTPTPLDEMTKHLIATADPATLQRINQGGDLTGIAPELLDAVKRLNEFNSVTATHAPVMATIDPAVADLARRAREVFDEQHALNQAAGFQSQPLKKMGVPGPEYGTRAGVQFEGGPKSGIRATQLSPEDVASRDKLLANLFSEGPGSVNWLTGTAEGRAIQQLPQQEATQQILEKMFGWDKAKAEDFVALANKKQSQLGDTGEARLGELLKKQQTPQSLGAWQDAFNKERAAGKSAEEAIVAADKVAPQEWVNTGSKLAGGQGEAATYVSPSGKQYKIDIQPQLVKDTKGADVTALRVTAHDETGKEVGRVLFDRRGTARGTGFNPKDYTAAGLSVDPLHQKQGLTNAMYDFAQSQISGLGKDHDVFGRILPSADQTAAILPGKSGSTPVATVSASVLPPKPTDPGELLKYTQQNLKELSHADIADTIGALDKLSLKDLRSTVENAYGYELGNTKKSILENVKMELGDRKSSMNRGKHIDEVVFGKVPEIAPAATSGERGGGKAIWERNAERASKNMQQLTNLEQGELQSLVHRKASTLSPDEIARMKQLEGVQEQARGLADWQKKLDLGALEQTGGFFGNHPLADMEKYLEGRAVNRLNAGAAYQAIPRLATSEAAGAIPVAKVMESLGLDLSKLDPGVQAAFLPKEQANALTNWIKPSVAPQGAQPWLNWFDSITNLTKAGQTSWPATQARNVLSDIGNRAFYGGSPIAPLMDAKTFREGGVIPNIAKRMGLEGASDADITKQLAREMYQLGLMDTKKFQAMEAAGVNPLLETTQRTAPLIGVPGAPLRQTLMNQLPNTVDMSRLNPLEVRGVGQRAESKFFPVAMAQSTQNYAEELNRMATYINARERGFAPLPALGEVTKAHLDFGNLSRFEKDVMRRVMPFYSWSRQNLPNIVAEISQNPGGRMAQTMRLLNSATDNGFLPENVTQTGYAVPMGQDERGRQNYLTSLGLPFEDLANLTSLRNILGSTNPIARLPYELATGRQVFTGQNVPSTFPFEGDPILNSVAMNSPLSRVLTTYRAAQRGLESGQIWPTATQLLAGPRITNVDPLAARRSAVRELANERLGNLPEISRFENLHVRPGQAPSLTPEQLQLLALYNSVNRPAR